jgi:hypothetical protein
MRIAAGIATTCLETMNSSCFFEFPINVVLPPKEATLIATPTPLPPPPPPPSFL